MLLCKACNTRFSEGPSACPSCGRRAFASAPDNDMSSVVEGQTLPAAKPPETPAQVRESPVGIELDELDVLAEAVDPAAAEESKPDPPARANRRIREPGPAVLHLSAAQVRTLVVEQPDLVEEGLAIYTDQRRRAVGVDFRTPVGAIDLLARDAQGGLVVVMVPDPRDIEALMPQVLGRVGYVRKHLAADGQPVRGVVVLEDVPELLAYAAESVSGTLCFKAYRVALTFHDLEF